MCLSHRVLLGNALKEEGTSGIDLSVNNREITASAPRATATAAAAATAAGMALSKCILQLADFVIT